MGSHQRRPGSRRAELGRRGEERACGLLISRGYLVIDRNWRCPHGEVDIVARDGTALVFCEVRTRSGTRYGTPLESVTPAKARRMGLVALAWLARFGPHPGPVRLDVLGLLAGSDGHMRVQHITGVQP